MSLPQKTRYAAGMLVLSLLLIGCEPSSKKSWQLSVYDPTSNQTHLITPQDVTQKVLIINYWAEWCKPCITEIPELNHFAAVHSDRIVMLGVNFDNKQGAALQDATHTVGMTFPAIISDPAKVFALPEITGLPTTLILDEHGILKEQLLGPQTLSSLEAAFFKP
jgi:thiol-disulfide isomerase/thioredoxin